MSISFYFTTRLQSANGKSVGDIDVSKICFKISKICIQIEDSLLLTQ